MREGASYHPHQRAQFIGVEPRRRLVFQPRDVKRGIQDDGRYPEADTYKRSRGWDCSLGGRKRPGGEADVLPFKEDQDIRVELLSVEVIKLAIAHQPDCELEMPEGMINIFKSFANCVYGIQHA